MDAKGVLEFAAKNNAKILDLRFTDLPGVWQHVSFPIQELSENSFKEGFGFDASSIRGWASIHESDMLLMPDPSTAFMDPFRDAPTFGFRPRVKEGYFPVPPTDHYQDLRTEMVQQLMAIGIDVECHHHEVGGAGQAEIDMRFATLLKSADNMMKYKYIVRNVAYQFGKSVTFMPKPLFGDNGSGMHTHQSLWAKGQPLFAGNGYAGLSQTALWYAGGLLKHAAAIVAFAAPTTNSYKRLVPGYDAPVNLAYSKRNRSAAVRIPVYSESPKARRLEFRPPDPSCNPYLAFAAMMMAGLDGIKNKIDPGQPLDKDLYELEEEEAAKVPSLPGSLEDTLRALRADYKFLLEGGVVSEELIDLWTGYKLKNEVDAVRMRPHPHEFHLYYDI